MILKLFCSSIIIVILGLALIFVLQLILNIFLDTITKLATKLFGSKIAWLILNVVPFVGTVHHELCHAILVVLSGAKLLHVQLFKISRYSLGKVTYVTRGNKLIQSLQNTLVSIAPTLFGAIHGTLILRFAYNNQGETWIKVLLAYLGISILLHSRMSKQDIKTAKRGLLLSILILTLIVFIIRLALGEINI